MREEFQEFYPLTSDEMRILWEEAIIVFDTNVLLRLFRYREKTANYVFEVLDHFKDRLWIPYQVGWEFQRNRENKIDEGRVAYKNIIKELERIENDLTKTLSELKDFGIHPAVNLDDNLDGLRQQVSSVREQIERDYENTPLDAHFIKIFQNLTDLYKGKVGVPYSDARLKELFKIGKQRYDSKVPPGFADAIPKAKEPEQRLYGDFLLWQQTLEHAKNVQKPVILVTEDIKKDWWMRTDDGKTKGPLPELRAEFRREVSKIFHMYRIDQFLKWAPEYGAPKKEEQEQNGIIEEVENVGRSQYELAITQTSENISQRIIKQRKRMKDIDIERNNHLHIIDNCSIIIRDIQKRIDQAQSEAELADLIKNREGYEAIKKASQEQADHLLQYGNMRVMLSDDEWPSDT
ncbi:PIN domain-containing protein [Azospirillum melinis]|uniref:PIN domain-containing protein n=1 Tax=Azospirillum melinis TaxID=328839 RepID=UPI00375733A7